MSLTGVLCLSCGAQICLTRCVRGRGSCAHPTPSRGPSVSHCDHPLPQGSSPTPTLSRHLCPSTSVSVCEGPEAFLLHHTLVWRFHTLCARAASSCQHSDYLAPLFRVSQQLPTMNRQVECNPTLEGSHMAFRLGWCHHGHHPSLRSARSPASLSKRVIRVTQERTKPKTVPQKKKPCLLGLTESFSQRNPLPHKPPNQRKNHWTDTISPSSVTCTLRLGIHQRNALWGFLCDVPRTTLTSSG